MSSSVVGAVLARSRRPSGSVPVALVMGAAAAGALLAELATVLWVGAPAQVWQPAVGGFVIGLMAGWFSGRKKLPPPKDQ